MKRVTIGTFSCGQSDIDSITSVLRNNLLSTGEETKLFEYKVAKLCKKTFGIFVNSGQSALEVALEYAKYKLDKKSLKVICPTTTYAATLWAILRTNCTPIFCDVNEEYNLDFKKILEDSKFLSCDVILNVDLCGKTSIVPDDIRNNYFIIEDACEAFGNETVGNADLVCFSFYVSHIITTGSGGMICGSQADLQNWVSSFISHGRVYGGDFTSYQDKWIDRFLFDKVGASYRGNNLLAGLGLSQLKKLDYIIDKRKRNAKILVDGYNNNILLQDKFIFPTSSYLRDCVFQFFPIVIKDKNINREKLLVYLYKHDIDSRVLLSLTNQPIFNKLFGQIEANNSDYYNKYGFIIGCHQDLGREEMEYVLKCLQEYCNEKND